MVDECTKALKDAQEELIQKEKLAVLFARTGQEAVEVFTRKPVGFVLPDIHRNTLLAKTNEFNINNKILSNGKKKCLQKDLINDLV
jgi:hypothetical protein